MRLLLRGYDPATRRGTSPALDCTGAQVLWEGPALTCDDGSSAAPAPPRPLGDDDVVSSPVAEEVALVWITATRYPTGDALGPVALVVTHRGHVRVKALGALRAYPRRATLRVEKLGTLDVLVAEGEACAASDPAACTRAARVLPVRSGRFVAQPFRGEDGRCASPAWVELSRRDRRRADDGWRVRELTAAMSFGPAGLTIEEQVSVSALGAKPGSAPPRLLDRAQATRTVRWVDGRLVATGAPLWAVGNAPGSGH
jgi:hypothetical protein